jgi:hypothetical protein
MSSNPLLQNHPNSLDTSNAWFWMVCWKGIHGLCVLQQAHLGDVVRCQNFTAQPSIPLSSQNRDIILISDSYWTHFRKPFYLKILKPAMGFFLCFFWFPDKFWGLFSDMNLIWNVTVVKNHSDMRLIWFI